MPENKCLEVTPEEFLKMISGSEPPPAPLLEGMVLTVAGSLDLSKTAAGRSVENIPECEIRGDLFAVGCENLKSARCFVRGSAQLDESGIEFLGGGFGVGGGLSAAGCKALQTVSGHIGAEGGHGDANLRGSGLVRLESDFSCEGDLVVEDCSALQALDCEVGGSVLALGSAISVLGPAFLCGRSLVLDGCRNFHRLERLRKSPADVHLRWSGIRTVTPGFSCLGDLILDDVPLLERLGGSVGGKIHVSEAPNLKAIDSVKVARGISVRKCPGLRKVSFSGQGPAFFGECGMTELSPPKGWEGDLALSGCPGIREVGGHWSGGVRLHSLPELDGLRGDFLCKESLEVHDCPKLSTMAGRTGGDAFIQGCANLVELGPGLKVGGRLIFGGGDSTVRSIGCLVDGSVVLARMTRLEETASTFRTGGELIVTDCPNFRALRGWVGGDTTVSDCPSIELIGADFEGGRKLLVKRCPPLKSLNCWIGGDVRIEEGGLLATGPAFHCGGKLRLKNSSGLKATDQGNVSEQRQYLRRAAPSDNGRHGSMDPSGGLAR